MSPIEILLADDHTLLRAGVRSLLEDLDGIRVVAEAGDGQEAIRLVEALRPRILLTDITMPGMSGLELAANVSRRYPETRVVILSMHNDEEYVLRAVTAGASGYLLKDSDTEELGLAVRAVARGENYLSPAVSKYLVADYRKQTAANGGHPTGLTARQLDVLRMIALGKTTKEISSTLNISIKTVEGHRALLMERLDIHHVAGLTRYAIRVGLITSGS
jgi:DNA-binding NarL/FixJ family response regulator